MSDSTGTTTKLDSATKVKEWLKREYPDTWPCYRVNELGDEFLAAPDMFWHMREAARSENRVIPNWWIDFRNIFGASRSERHYLHNSATDPRRIAYTPTPEYGRADRQVVTSVGKYLTKHFSDLLDSDAIRAYADQHRLAYGTSEVRFAFGADEIEQVYANGPRSCMSNPSEYNFSRHVEHPVRVYDGPDTALAYLAKNENEYSARALVRLDTTPMRYLRVYGDATLLEPRLKALGFLAGNNGCAGARLRIVRAPGHNNPICPYIDNCDGAEDVGDFLVPNDDAEGEYTCQNVTGYCDENEDEEANQQCCEHCEDWYDEETDGHHDSDDRWICQDCLDHNFTYAYSGRNNNQRWVHNDDVVECVNEYYHNTPRTLDWHDVSYSDVDDAYVKHDDATYLEYKNEWTMRETVTDHNGHQILAVDAITVDDYVFEQDDPPDEVEFVDGEWRFVPKPEQLTIFIEEPA